MNEALAEAKQKNAAEIKKEEAASEALKKLVDMEMQTNMPLNMSQEPRLFRIC